MGVLKYIWKFGELKRLHAASVMLVCDDVDRGFIFFGKRYAQLLDSINDRLIELGIGTLTVSLSFSKLSPDSVYGNFFSVNGVLARAGIKDKLIMLLARSIQYRCAARVKTWSAILSRVQPKVIIGIQPSRELCIAAKKMGIWIADLQHGIISDEGYYGLAFRAKYGQEGWPSCVLCWDTVTENWIQRQIGPLVSTKIIGHPWVIRFINPRESDKLVYKYVSTVVPEKSNRLAILVSLQWGPGQEGGHYGIGISQVLLRFIKEHGKSFDWWLRVHPVMLQGSRRAATFSGLAKEFSGCANVYWEQCTDLPLPLVLKQADLHMTTSSAVTVEAGWFGVKTALLSANKNQLYQWLGEEIRSGSADIVPAESAHIKQWIEQNTRLARDLSSLDCVNEQHL
ncbi:MAG: hypothetical protein J0653_03550, partial [Deltaproteobacteria bacterium]|nr:hypothetical protein [Deltaproteobacteria bacterium]